MTTNGYAWRITGLRASALILVPLFFIVSPVWGFANLAHEAIEVVGILILLVGVLGRFWAILYVGSKKATEIVTDGPYSLTRNPLYLFSTIATFGIGLMFGAVFYAVLLAGTIGTILYLTARREEAWLAERFGAPYAAYAREVPFFLPRLTGYRSETRVTFDVPSLTRNLRDALVFLAFIPLVEVFDWLKLALPAAPFRVW